MKITDEMVAQAQQSLNADADAHQRAGNVIVRAALEAAFSVAPDASPLAQVKAILERRGEPGFDSIDCLWAIEEFVEANG
jgi:hypothetical protein